MASSGLKAWTRSCVSVNDAFVMFQWGRHVGAGNVFLLLDGNGEFTRKMGMLVDKSNVGFVLRSWRYVMVVNDGLIEKKSSSSQASKTNVKLTLSRSLMPTRCWPVSRVSNRLVSLHPCSV